MKVDKLTKDILTSISDTIKYVAENDKQHIPDKICCLKNNISLIELEIEKLKKLHTSNGG